MPFGSRHLQRWATCSPQRHKAIRHGCPSWKEPQGSAPRCLDGEVEARVRTGLVLFGGCSQRKGNGYLQSDNVRGTSFVLGPCADLGVTSPPILSLVHICTHAHLYPLGRCDCQEGELGRLPGERATLSGLSLLPVGPLSLPDCAGSWAKCRPHARNG